MYRQIFYLLQISILINRHSNYSPINLLLRLYNSSKNNLTKINSNYFSFKTIKIKYNKQYKIQALLQIFWKIRIVLRS